MSGTSSRGAQNRQRKGMSGRVVGRQGKISVVAQRVVGSRLKGMVALAFCAKKSITLAFQVGPLEGEGKGLRDDQVRKKRPATRTCSSIHSLAFAPTPQTTNYQRCKITRPVCTALYISLQQISRKHAAHSTVISASVHF
jgi:hypothetical protein